MTTTQGPTLVHGAGNRASTRRRSAASELRRTTWPLPWWVVVLPGLLICLVTALWVARAGTWAYVSLPVLSGLAHESVAVTGPASAAFAGWVAATFLDRRSPVAWPVAVRAARSLPGRTIVVLLVWWTGAQVVGVAVPTVVLAGRARAGRAYPTEILLAAPMLASFVLAGLLLGAVCARWYATLLAFAWGLAQAFVVPTVFGIVLGDDVTFAGSFFLFPGTAAFDHPPFVPTVWAQILAWWSVLVAACALLILGWFTWRAGNGIRFLATSLAAWGTVTATGWMLALSPQTLYAPDVATASVCRTLGRGVEVCVAEEEQALLGPVVEAARVPLGRLTPWPEDIRYVTTERGRASLEAESGPLPDSQVVVGSGPEGAPSVGRDIGNVLGGLFRCDGERSGQEEFAWAFELSLWISGDPEGRAVPGDPVSQSLYTATAEQVGRWYAAHQEAILACRYTGSGP